MKPTFIIFLFFLVLLFICFAGMCISGVLIDHGIVGRIWAELFAVTGMVLGIPTLFFGFAASE